MDVGATNRAAALNGPGGIGAGTYQAPDNVAVEKESFLKLLVAQISNQDPLAPQDSEQYMQQLTQFSTLEQLMNLNDGVQNLAIGQLSNNSQEALRFVGREVVARGDQVELGEDGATARFTPAEDAASVTITYYDADGAVAFEKTMPAQPGGMSYTWDGMGDDGVRRKPGRYTVAVQAKDADGNPEPVDAMVRGKVTGVRFDQGFPELLVGNQRLRLSDVVEVL